MDDRTYQVWASLHRRFLDGESLTETERSAYETGCQELDDAQPLTGDIDRIQELRAKVAEADRNLGVLLELRAKRKRHLAELEAQLDPPTRELLDIGN